MYIDQSDSPVCAVDKGVVLAGAADCFWPEEQVDKTSAVRLIATMDKYLKENMIESPLHFGYDHLSSHIKQNMGTITRSGSLLSFGVYRTMFGDLHFIGPTVQHLIVATCDRFANPPKVAPRLGQTNPAVHYEMCQLPDTTCSPALMEANGNRLHLFRH
jgi:hypothetical protein